MEVVACICLLLFVVVNYELHSKIIFVRAGHENNGLALLVRVVRRQD